MPLFKIGSIYYVSLSHKGQRIKRSAHTDNQEQAQEFHDILKAKLWRGEILGDKVKDRHTWTDAAQIWLKAKPRSVPDAYRLQWFNTKWESRSLESIDGEEIEEVLDEKDWKPATINRAINHITAILNIAVRKGWLEKLPHIERPEVVASRTFWLTGKQWIKLRDKLPPHLRQMARFAIATGLRRHNVTHLEWSQIDMRRRVAWVHPDQTKQGAAISVPLSEDALAVLEEQLEATDPDTGESLKHDVLVFPMGRSARKSQYKDEAQVQTSTKAWKTATKAAGVPWCRWHDLRHTWASWHIMQGTPLEVLQKIGGWKTLQMVQRYAHLSPGHLAKFANNAQPVDNAPSVRNGPS